MPGHMDRKLRIWVYPDSALICHCGHVWIPRRKWGGIPPCPLCGKPALDRARNG